MASNPLATPAQLAEWLQISTDALSKLRIAGTGPKFIKIGREIRYAWADVHQWCDSLRKGSTSEGASNG
jgi:predicted DNA-binding transcriptional regulator AlpA